jgi:hypothetical protein
MVQQLTLLVDTRNQSFHSTTGFLSGRDKNAWFHILNYNEILIDEVLFENVTKFLKLSGIARTIFHLQETAPNTYVVQYEPSGLSHDVIESKSLKLMSWRTDVLAGKPVIFSRCPLLGVSWTPEIISEHRIEIIYGLKTFDFLIELFESVSAEVLASRIERYCDHARAKTVARLIRQLEHPQSVAQVS